MFDVTDKNNIGKEYNGFILLGIDELADYKTQAVFLRHKKTGLEIYHILKEDKENLFAFAFRTFANDSKGCAHIMEHSTLCGSEKYPLKEPFTTLAGTSLNTFLNALTYPDKTVYPGASVIRADYFNMMDVYADAVFFPKLDYTTFIQEGHRLELDENGNLSIQGVVYNEMKGNYSSFKDIAVDAQIRTMYPDCFASFDSGGDPLNIPELTYEEFLEFHQKFYNPDNCLLYLYGNIPTCEQLDFLNERFISRLEKKYNCKKDIEKYNSALPIVKTEIKELQKLNLIQKSTEVRCIAPKTGSTGEVVTMNWYSGTYDMEKYYLSEVLCGNDSSPLSFRLMNSKLGDDLSPIWSNFGQFQEEFFTYGLSGVKKKNEQKVYDLVQKSLIEIYEEGISQNDIDSAVMGIDFSLREVTRYFGPYSLVLMDKVLKGWNYGNACSTQLSPISTFEKLKEKIKNDKDFTRNLIKKYFLDNNVVVKLVVEPSDKFFKEREDSERKLIKKLSLNLDKEKLKKELESLHAYQQSIETPEDTACIPKTKLSELDRNLDIPKLEISEVEGNNSAKIPLFLSEEDTNGIFYVDVLFPFDTLGVEKMRHIPFLTNILTNIGWNSKPWNDCITESSCVMGDVWGRALCGAFCDSPQALELIKKYEDKKFMNRQWIGVSCKALTYKAKETFELLSEIITKMDFLDEKRFDNLLAEFVADKKASFVADGRNYILKRTSCLFDKDYALGEILWGVSQFKTISEYMKNGAKKTLQLFKDIYKCCMESGAVVHITADKDSFEKINPLISDFVKASDFKALKPAVPFSVADIRPYIINSEAAENNEVQILKVHSQTGYAASCTKSSSYLSKEAAGENVLASWLGNHSLWDKIRTMGGAYGAMMWIDNIHKASFFSSYRDPTPEKSLEVFKSCIKEIAEKEFSKEEVEQTVVACYGDAIVPRSPIGRANSSFENFLYANPSEFKTIRINNVLEVLPEDVHNAAQRFYKWSEELYNGAIFVDKSKKCSGNKINIPL